ncbi:MAG: hypothetical protein RIR97_38 [Pseudomonadota bacterium]
MTLFETISGFLWGNIIVFILVISLLVFVHEMGHYVVGRWCGIRIQAFSVGFGPELLGWTDRHGTRWKLSAIPLGGYVKFLGDANASSEPDFQSLASMTEEDRRATFPGAALWKRALTVAAGPLANFLLAILIFSATFYVYGRSITDPVVGEVKAESAAAVAGILPGDRLVAIDGIEVETFDDVRRYVSIRPGTTIIVTVERDGQMLPLTMVPKRTEIEDQFGNKLEAGIIGVVTTKDVANFRIKTYSLGQSVQQAVFECWYIVKSTYDYIANVFAGQMSADQFGGPVRVSQVTGQVATLGVWAVFQLAAALSVSIGLINLLPVPVLDGGHLVFYAIEAIRRRPLSPKAQEVAFRIGFALIMTLMVFVTWNDTVGRLLG